MCEGGGMYKEVGICVRRWGCVRRYEEVCV